jgi:hypothetical protein
MKGQTAIVSTCFLFELICLPTCVNLVAVMDAGLNLAATACMRAMA